MARTWRLSKASMSDEGSTGGDIYVVPIAGGAARNLTPSIKASPICARVDGTRSHHFRREHRWQFWFRQRRPLRRRNSDTLDGRRVRFTGMDASGLRDRSNGDQLLTAIVRQSPSAPPEVWAGPIGDWKQLTDINASAKPTWGEMRNVHWTNGTTQVQGWLLHAQGFLLQQNLSTGGHCARRAIGGMHLALG